MHSIENKYSVSPGDMLVRNKSLMGVVDHYGLYIGNGQVIDNHPSRGVSIVTIGSFLSGRNLERVNYFKGNAWERNRVVEWAYSMLGRKYHLTEFNCEHFVRMAWGEGRKSRQVSMAVGLFWIMVAGLMIGSLGKS